MKNIFHFLIYRNRNRLNQNGLGLAEILIASAILIIVFAGVAYFITGQKKTAIHITENASCQNIAASIATEFSKDDANIDLKSYGPRSLGMFKQNENMGPDGIPYFKDEVESVAQANLTKNMSNQSVDVSSFEWRFRNSLNVRNSFNRLLALANSNAAFRCMGLDINCGADVSNLPKVASLLASAPPGTTAQLGIDIFVQDTQLFSNPPNLGSNYYTGPQDGAVRAEFQVVVTMPQPNGTTVSCAQQSRAQFSIDRTPPLVLLEIQDSELCGSNPPINAANLCGSDPNDTWIGNMRVYTVRDTPQCRACMQRETDISRCPNSGNIANCLAADCTPSDPGSIFLCRFGEKNWLNSAGRDLWQPCHSSKTYSESGTSLGSNMITYLNNYPGHEKRTVANISTALLPTDRAYNFDVRAVDASGIMAGSSFCEVTGHCDVNSGTGLVGSSSPPSIVSTTSGSQIVARAVAPPTGGSSPYPTASAVFGSSLFQCQNGQATFVTQLQYPIGGSGLGIETCTATFVAPSAGTATCTCDLDGSCIIQATPTTDGNATLSITVRDVCGRQDTDTINWCIDTLAFNDFRLRNFGDFTSVGPNFTGATNKKCGLAYLCPKFGGDYDPQLNACRPSDYSAPTHSGCATKILGVPPVNNLCIKAVDPCGRILDSNPKGNYGILLSTQGSAGRICLQGPGGGNYCDPGAPFCTRDTICANDCGYNGVNCTNNPAAPDSQRCSFAINCNHGFPGEITGSCSTTYQCNSSTGTRIEPQGCIDQQACSIMGACLGAKNGTCSNGVGICREDGDCTAPNTCNGAVQGTCDNEDTDKHGIACWDASECEDPGTCSIRDQGVCSCPTNKFCPGPGLFREVCPDLTSCAAPPPPPPSPPPSPSPVASPSPTPEASPSPTPEASPSPTPEASPSPTPTASVTCVPKNERTPAAPGSFEQFCQDTPQLDDCPDIGTPPESLCPTVDLTDYCPGGTASCTDTFRTSPGPFEVCHETYGWICQTSWGSPGYVKKCVCP